MFFLIISVILVFTIVSLLFGSLIKYYYDGGKKYSALVKIALFVANIPLILNSSVNNKSTNPKKPPILTKHKEKKRFQQFLENNREGLLVLPRYDHSLSRAVVDVICLNKFKTIHTYKHDISAVSTKENIIRFGYYHPLVLEDGSLISESTYSPLFKIDFKSNLEWINDEIVFHHSKEVDHEKNIWIPARLKPFSKYIKKFQHPIDDFRDDAIVKINTDGKILFKKSVTEILIENKIGDMINRLKKTVKDPIHLNCIEPALSDTNFWKKGDLFLSLKHHSAIILYRPDENKVINYITGPFAQQHDVDIVSKNEISIFNNNNFFIDNEFSEVLIYNFQTKQFRKLFNEQLRKENFKVSSSGMSQILNDGSLMVEEQTDGRIILFNNKGEKEWEFVNKDINGNIGDISWSRIIEDKDLVRKFKSLVELKDTSS
jgi:hypothetical protein